MVDADLADLYGVPTGALNQAVRRNMQRFAEDFAFRLSKAEFEHWKPQIVISNPSAKMALRHAPFVFTQEGVAMLSAVLRSDRAASVIEVLAEDIDRLAREVKDMKALPPVTKRRIGFIIDDE